ncbi:MAG: HAD family hydrolase [Anaerobacillus sp.]|uniref:HAD family hydrolase n=1 Tax=Anaerobacillus sp. TaxID=1872506 RepID=UPI0039199654
MVKKAFFFDLDDTLYDQLQPFKEAVICSYSTIEELPFEKIFKRSREYSDILWDQYCSNKVSLEELRVKRLVLAFEDFKYKLEPKQAMEIQERYEERQNKIKLSKGVISCLTSLKEKGFLVGIITNGPVEHQMKKIINLQLDAFVSKELIFISDGVGIAKPDPRIFLHVNNRIGIKPENCYYAGDSWRNDVVPSLNAGWNSVWYNFRCRKPETTDIPYKVIYSYHELDM